MPTDPYKILGINYNASDDEIKRAYRELAKKYHPDNFKDNPLSDLANEKMKAINEAYDSIQRERSGINSNGSNGSNGSGHYYNSYTSNADFSKIRDLINSNRFSEAEIFLDSITNGDRVAEWYFLKGVILTKRGWFFDAQKNFQTACSMDPNNPEYKDALRSMKTKSNSYYNTGYDSRHTSKGCSGCDLCAGLMCADCLCECMGGDLIRCC